MSDSDDTDLLLLIPPDFFFVAPSPSPASSPSTLSPPPAPKLSYKKGRPLTEELARKSLEEITSKLKVIDERLNFIESQRSADSMDGDRSSNWFDLDSIGSGSTKYRPPDSMDKVSERRSTNVQELIQASVRDPQSVLQRKVGPHTQSWGPSGRDSQFHFSQIARCSSGRIDGATLARAPYQEKDGSSDEEGEADTRERRSSSLPPTPSSHRLQKKLGGYPESMSFRPRSLYRELGQPTPNMEDTTSRFSNEMERNSKQRTTNEVRGRSSTATPLFLENGRFAQLDFGNREEQSLRKKGGEKNSVVRESGSDWVDRRTSGEERSNQSLGTEGDESFNMNLSNLDGTLGVSAILPSLSSLGLGTSGFQGSLNMTKESGTSLAGGPDGGFSLSEVERLLEDMHKTQIEMERSMRRGKAQLLNRRDEGQGNDSKVDSSIGETDVKEDLSICKKGLVQEEVQRREGWVMEGKSGGSPKQSNSSPVKIVVDGAPKKSQPTDKMEDFQGIAAKFSAERERIEGLMAKDGPPIYRSKSDESLTGGHGKSSGGHTRGKYLGVDSNDDSFISSGPLTSKNITRLGDTLGSVPDLGLGVREMFANPEKYREPVEEPPFTKKNMSLLGCSNPASLDAQTAVAQGIKTRVLESYEKPPSNRKTPDCPQICSGNASREVRPKTHSDVEATGISQIQGQGNSANIGMNPGAHVSQPMQNVPVPRGPSLAPQKYLYSPQSLVENQENSGRDARRQIQLEKMKSKEPELHSQLPRDNASRHASVDEDVRVNPQEKGEEIADGTSDQEDLTLPKPMGPVMVVGGEGRQRKRRKAGENDGFGWEGSRGGRQLKNDGSSVGKSQGHWWNKGNGIGRNGRGAWNESRRKWATQDGGHKSLDDYLGQSRGRRFKDSGFHDDGAQSFPWDPSGAGRRFLGESDMWDPPLTPGLTAAEEIITLRRKLEEERFRREHCERVIEEVGRRALESQERLAVCQGLGKAKDVALGKFREAWEEAVSGWKREAEARKSLEDEVDRYRDRVDAEIAFRDQRQKQLEAEMVRLGAESSTLREELRKGQREMADVTARLSGMLEAATKEVTTTRKECESAVLKEARAQDAAAKAEEKVKDAMTKLDESTQRANGLEAEKSMMKQELETVQGKLKDCMGRIATLETRLADAEVATDHARLSEKKACEERMAAQQELEKERVNLKEYYQTQVEEVVKSKVKELQGQLDSIVLSLRKETEMREELAKRQGEERLKLLSQKHSQEVSLLEQKHEEELSLWSLRLKRAVSEAEKLRAWRNQLTKGMQSQLKEMSRFIAFGNEGVENKSFSSPPKKPEKKTSPGETSWRDVMASLNYHDTSDVIPEKDVVPKKDTDQDLGYASMIKEKTEKEAVSSGSKHSLPNSDLKKYIQMLLDREPGKPVSLMDIGSESDEDVEIHNMEVKQRQPVETKEVTKPMKTTESEKMNVKEHKASKKARRKEGGGTFIIKQSKDAHLQAMWEPMALKLSEPCSSGQLFEGEKCELEGQRSRKPPWK
ncbi:uncharacterized protein LOC124163255 [Ischnura elegans]|uniref:uncharacterized protein LOC124163255 n=1 Tax=Ischnura elegans TaxID=197161 RepID=UPI001ED88C41|nr:uncharacterized protein LOC124163255 [Ischnura elegans]XP_046395986.1 uncharacterized protein LOC124163255 [Ischnura elegans]XP_046395987.1 uncharacterized protein LOC124163255 [Ischnura elegans]XP_046395988.1 uncharacterized protein LOC124163255 [Ischnura elegans]XP_046395989.1 uncharacterized protein LOC124163255 [Ischnura elegans]